MKRKMTGWTIGSHLSAGYGVSILFDYYGSDVYYRKTLIGAILLLLKIKLKGGK